QPQACDAGTAERIRRLRAGELHALLVGGGDGLRGVGGGPLLLVDVREPREFEAGHLAGAVNIPLAEIGDRLREIPVDATPVFICRSGARSLVASGIAVR